MQADSLPREKLFNITLTSRVLAGVLAFLMVEKLVRIARGSGHGHSHSPPSSPTVERKQITPDHSSTDTSETQIRQRKSNLQESEQESESSSKTKKVRFANVDDVVNTDADQGTTWKLSSLISPALFF